mgnify:FL=1
MSHSHFVYPQSTNDLTLINSSRWQVREDDGEYDVNRPDLTEISNLSDFITDKLTKAEALSWVLQGAKHYPENADAVTAMVIAELIHEALEANEKQWELTRQVVDRES